MSIKFNAEASDKKLSFTNILVKDPAHTQVTAPTAVISGEIVEIATPLTNTHYVNGVPVKPTGLGLLPGDKINIKRVFVGFNTDSNFAVKISAEYEHTLVANSAGIAIETTVPAGVFAVYYLIKLPSMSQYHLLPTGALNGLSASIEIPVLHSGLQLQNYVSEAELSDYVSDLYNLKAINLGFTEKTPEVKTVSSVIEVEMHNGPSLFYDESQTEEIMGNFTINSFEGLELLLGGNILESGTSGIGITGGHEVNRRKFFVKYGIIRNGKISVNGYYGILANEEIPKISENRTTELIFRQQPNIVGRGINALLGYFAI